MKTQIELWLLICVETRGAAVSVSDNKCIDIWSIFFYLWLHTSILQACTSLMSLPLNFLFLSRVCCKRCSLAHNGSFNDNTQLCIHPRNNKQTDYLYTLDKIILYFPFQVFIHFCWSLCNRCPDRCSCCQLLTQKNYLCNHRSASLLLSLEIDFWADLLRHFPSISLKSSR